MAIDSMAEPLQIRLISCVGTEFDTALLPFFIGHYLALGIAPADMHFIVHSRDRDRPDFGRALAILERAGVGTAQSWLGPYTSDEMWRRRRQLQRSIASVDDWIINADVDEFHEYPDTLERVAAFLGNSDFNALQGPFIDRIAADGGLPEVSPSPPLGEQFPIEADVMCPIGKIPGKQDAVGTIKLMLFRASIMPSLGGHNPEPVAGIRFAAGQSLAAFENIKKADFRFSLPACVHHFKWRDSLLHSTLARFETEGASPAGSEYGQRLYAYFRRSGNRIRLGDIRVRPSTPASQSGGTQPAGPGLQVPQQRFPAWQGRYRELSKQAHAQAPQTESAARIHKDTEADHPLAADGWRVRQLTTGTADAHFHSHSYYDIPIVDPTGSLIAAHEMCFQNRWMTPDDKVRVGVVAVDDGGFEPLAETTAWSWQQGPMAQWIPGSRSLVWNHRRADCEFVGQRYDVDTGEAAEFDTSIYAIDPAGGFALGVNMARLDTVRPGYGYAADGVDTPLAPAPADDGVWRLDLATGESRLILSLERAVACLYDSIDGELYQEIKRLPPAFWFNHVKISPDGRRFTLKLRWRDAGLRGGWTGRMGVSLTCNTDGTDLAFLKHATSHVMWWTNSILYYWHERTRCLKFIKDSRGGGIDLGALDRETFSQNVHIRHWPGAPFGFIYDLPYRETVELAEFDLRARRHQPIASFANHIPAHGPFRCDLHPVPCPDGARMIVTSLHDGGRQLYAVERTTAPRERARGATRVSQSSGSRLVMTLLVRNEADIIESNIRFHLALGVDHVVVTDNDSSDGTREILEEFERSGVLTLIDEASPDYLQEVWVSRMATLARDRLAADWVISNDADEFWRPREGTLKTLVSSSNADAIECNRKNLLTAFEELDEQPWHDGLRFRTSTSPTKPELEDIYRDPMPQPFFYFDLSLKVIARTRGLRRIERGAHQAVFDRPARLAKGALDIYHFPIRSASAFERKIVRIGEAVRRTPGLAENISWKYRRWLSFLEHDGNAQRALADALPDARKLAHDRATGLIVEDSTLRRDLSAMGIAPSDFET